MNRLGELKAPAEPEDHHSEPQATCHARPLVMSEWQDVMTSTVPVSSKLPDIGVSIFAVQTRLANEHKAINLSQGFPDFDCDPALVEAVAKAMREGHNQYAPMPGVLALREGIAAKIEQLYGPTYDP